MQWRESLHVLRGFCELRLGLPEHTVGLVQGGFELSRIDLEEGVPGVDKLPFLVDLPQQVAFHLGAYNGVHRAVQGTDPLADHGNVLLDNGDRANLRLRRPRRWTPSTPEIEKCGGQKEAAQGLPRCPPAA